MQTPSSVPDERTGQLLEALFDLIGALKQRAHSREDPATLFLLRHIRTATPLRVSDLAGSSRLDVSTVSRHVRRLEEAGLLRRTEDRQDRRVSLLEITDEGAALLRDAMGARAAALAEGMAGWSEHDRATLTTLLSRLARAVGAATDGASGGDGASALPALDVIGRPAALATESR